MNEKNYTQAEMDAMKKRKKRKISEISSNNQHESANTSRVQVEPASSVKECPFNPFGNDSCDMCGS